MTFCKTCKHARLLFGQCRAESPRAFLVPVRQGIQIIGRFPTLPVDQTGCGQYVPADESEMASLDVAQKEVAKALQEQAEQNGKVVKLKEDSNGGSDD